MTGRLSRLSLGLTLLLALILLPASAVVMQVDEGIEQVCEIVTDLPVHWEKVDPLIWELLELMGNPDFEGANEELDLLTELIALPESGDLYAGFFLDVLIGVDAEADTSELSAEYGTFEDWTGDRNAAPVLEILSPATYWQELRGLTEEFPDELVRPSYEGVIVYPARVWIQPGPQPEEQIIRYLAEDERVIAIEPSFINTPELDVSLGNGYQGAWTGIDVESARGQVLLGGDELLGKNVIVGIIDGGIDWDHAAFTNPGPPETSRILWQWDQKAGIFASNDEINGNLAGSVLCGTGGDHGSHVAGIAAGGDTGMRPSAAGRFPGIAQQASIVDVRSELEDMQILLGAGLIFLDGWFLGSPSVVNLSCGDHYGPHDGTDLLSRGLAALVGPGRVIVKSAGNSGDAEIHTDNDGSRIAAGATGSIQVNAPAGATQIVVRIWGAAANVYTTDIIASGVNLVTVASGGVGTGGWTAGRANAGYVRVESNVVKQGASVDRLTQVRIFSTRGQIWPGVWTIELQRPGAAGDGYYDAWVANSTGAQAVFVAPTAKELISDPGNSTAIITVGSFNTKGGAYDSCRPLGAVSAFSSVGPTRETRASAPGTQKPNLLAPGCTIESAMNSQGSASSQFVTMRGTSMAAPHMTGAVALMLQVNPDLTPAQIIAALQAGWFVRFDPAVSGPADNTCGCGKLCVGCDGNSDGVLDILQLSQVFTFGPWRIQLCGEDLFIVDSDGNVSFSLWLDSNGWFTYISNGTGNTMWSGGDASADPHVTIPVEAIRDATSTVEFPEESVNFGLWRVHVGADTMTLINAEDDGEGSYRGLMLERGSASAVFYGRGETHWWPE